MITLIFDLKIETLLDYQLIRCAVSYLNYVYAASWTVFGFPSKVKICGTIIRLILKDTI